MPWARELTGRPLDDRWRLGTRTWNQCFQHVPTALGDGFISFLSISPYSRALKSHTAWPLWMEWLDRETHGSPHCQSTHVSQSATRWCPNKPCFPSSQGCWTKSGKSTIKIAEQLTSWLNQFMWMRNYPCCRSNTSMLFQGWHALLYYSKLKMWSNPCWPMTFPMLFRWHLPTTRAEPQTQPAATLCLALCCCLDQEKKRCGFHPWYSWHVTDKTKPWTRLEKTKQCSPQTRMLTRMRSNPRKS